MQRIVVVAAIGLVLAMVGRTATGQESPAKRFIERGDRYYGKRESGSKWVEKSAQCYEKALAVDTKNVEASWKYARSAYWLGTHSEEEADKLRIFKQAIDITKRAVSIDEKSVESRFWLGISYAKYGEAKGIVNSLALVEPMRKEMKRVLEIDPKFAGGGAYRVLGWISHKLPGIAGGSDKEAIELLNKAVALDEGHLLNHLCLAEIYRVTDRPEEARKHIRFILDAPIREDRAPEDKETKAAAKEMLEKMEKPE